MKTSIFLTLALLTAPFSFALEPLISAHPDAKDDSFTTIYDGKDLSKVATKGNWQIQDDGSLKLTPREGEKGWKRYPSYLWLKESYGDFAFDFEFKYGKGGNSGFYFRCADEVDPTASGFEVQILDCFGKKDIGKHDMGGIIKTKGAMVNASKPAGEWQRLTIYLKGDHLTAVLNGKLIQNLNLRKAKPKDKKLVTEGRICIQDHGQAFEVRNLKVKRL